MPKATIPAEFAPWSNLWRKWHSWLLSHNVSPVYACLAYPLSFPQIDRIVVGADSVDQLKQIVSLAASALPVDLPNLNCEAENLINPSHWSQL